MSDQACIESREIDSWSMRDNWQYVMASFEILEPLAETCVLSIGTEELMLETGVLRFK